MAARDAYWTNSDGLVVGFGTREVAGNTASVVSSADGMLEVVLPIIGTQLEDTDSVTAASVTGQGAVIPRGALLERAVLQVHEAFTSGGSATLDLGTYDADNSSITVDDADGIDVDIALTAIDAIGDTIVCDGALIGGQVGATSNSDVTLVAAYQTAAFTAGKATLVCRFQLPRDFGRTLAV